MPTKTGNMTKKERAKKYADELCKLANKVARLQRIIDSRPAINAGLPETYIEWSQSIYQMDINEQIGHDA
jgi:hypothetical protein